MSINCEILDLRAFLTIVELTSFNRAAEVLHISQPALSRRMQKLEEIIGAPLLERTTRHVGPTALGNELLPLVRRLIEEFDGSLFAARDKGVKATGLVTIACLPTAAFYFLPRIISRFSLQYPEIRFRILDLTATDGLQAVNRGEVEFGINIISGIDSELAFEPLMEDKFVLAVKRDHPLAKKEVVLWEDLKPYSLITVHNSSANRILLEAALAKENIKINWRYEVTHLSTSLGFVEAGLGISVLPQMATPQGEHPFLVTRPIVNPTVSRMIGVVKRRGSILSPAAQHFYDMLLNEWK
ncbi:LysR family transcriptional regulator [Bartonella sp. HY406]|uniref:LysR family transcriptional regulator n=1 Tax=Bartonella sp. HY406 TaxID=2979331 RepID=UPI0021CA575C|nr:LysR family transcriptional regulator [Bartonella sp. HY406]UXN04441.1 LysR substrate-binding domain-containing protein [Bartonella sp. HY406]